MYMYIYDHICVYVLFHELGIFLGSSRKELPTGDLQVAARKNSLGDMGVSIHGDIQNGWFIMGFSINGGTPKWMVYNGKSH